jgi:hypothetical protein
MNAINTLHIFAFLIYRWRRLNFKSSGADFSPAPVSVMKLDTTHLRYLSENDFRVLTAVDPLLDVGTNTKGGIGSKNHLVVPTPLITQIAKLRSGNAARSISELAKAGLISRLRNAKCLSALMSILTFVSRRWISIEL